MMKKIVLLTCTGDRFAVLDMCAVMVHRAIDYYKKKRSYDVVIDWVVIDDGITAYNPGDCVYYRRKPDGPNSLLRNLKSAMLTEEVLAADCLLFWEDDDWYRQDRIVLQADYLQKIPMHGWSNTMYYHLTSRKFGHHRNMHHSSLFETGIRRDAYSTLNTAIGSTQGMFVDITLWKLANEKQKLLTPFDGVCVGMKGLPGRKGLGSGHTPNTPVYRNIDDEKYTELKKHIGKDDFRMYIELLHKALNL